MGVSSDASTRPMIVISGTCLESQEEPQATRPQSRSLLRRSPTLWTTGFPGTGVVVTTADLSQCDPCAILRDLAGKEVVSRNFGAPVAGLQ